MRKSRAVQKVVEAIIEKSLLACGLLSIAVTLTIAGVIFYTGLEEPIVFWVPAIAISGLSIYNGDKFPAWKGQVFVGAMQHGARSHELLLDVLISEEYFAGQ